MAKKHVIVMTAGDNTVPVVAGSSARKRNANRLSALFKALAGGAVSKKYTIDTRSSCAVASGTVTYSTSSGAQTVVVNGVTVSTHAGQGSDAANATKAAADINASSNALISGVVTASAASGVCTVTAVVPGVAGNCVTLSCTGTGATASGARLTGGSETRISFDY